MPNLIALAIPFFFLGILIEALVARRRGLSIYRLGDALADMGCGISQQLAGMFISVLLLAGYVHLYDNYRLFTLPGWAGWVVAFVGVDFVYYWWHRLSHEVNFLWAAHGVHHQSEDYNLAVALRQSVFTSSTFFPFLGTLAFLGVPPLALGVIAALNNLYQFWIHTELIKTLGPLERVVNTPALHRVHHAINPKYLDRNHGGTFMLWDHLFGTYQKEEEQCVYGVTKPLGSFNSIWAQLDGFWNLVQLARHAPGPLQALQVFVRSPGWRAPWFPAPALAPVTRREQQTKYDPQTTRGRRLWALAQFTLMVLATFSLLMWGKPLAIEVKLGAVALIYLALINVAGLLEGRRWVVPFEVARWAVTAVAVGVFFAR